MKSKSLPLIVILFVSTSVFSQQNPPSRLKVFIDCSTWCDIQYIRSEINLVDFLHSNTAADVHVLITSYYTGSGGQEYQLIFFGQQSFKNQTDTLRFNTHMHSTEFEDRDMLLKYIKAGLVPFISKTTSVKNIEINLKATESTENTNDSSRTHDPWNAWVFRIGADGNINADANYQDRSFSGNISADRITEKTKIGFFVYGSKNKSVFEFEDTNGTDKFEVNNHNWAAEQYLVKSISPHWSWSYKLSYSQNTFSNIKGRAFGWLAAEYNIFPYKEVTNKLITFSYGITARHNKYYDTTIYNKTQERLYGHQASVNASFNQKWGNLYAGVTYHNYFHDWSLYNLGVNFYTSVRVTGGLSFYVSGFGGLTHDQVFLVKGNATPEEVLARRRQLASGYNFYTSVGLTYQFGSQLNNVVNPRFDYSSVD